MFSNTEQYKKAKEIKRDDIVISSRYLIEVCKERGSFGFRTMLHAVHNIMTGYDS